MKRRLLAAATLTAVVLWAEAGRTQGQSTKPLLYVVGTSHLDSQWNWTVQDSIRSFVPATFFENFALFEKYPNYTFSYEGAIHYMWFKEYHPEAWETLQKYVAAGRWRIAGNWINAVDVNVPSPESLMRQALYAKGFFRQEFGKVGQDVYLPDCFGFGFALPSIAAHSGLSAFTTQKLTWGSSYGIPFPIGRWRGVDGSEVVAALNPGAYVTKVQSDVSSDPKWSDDPTRLAGGRQVVYRLFGTGDIGGAPDAASVEWLEKSLANRSGNVDVRNTSVDQLSRDLTPAEVASLPVYEGELTMKTHGVGTYTSQSANKKFNRENERLADAAERAATAADSLGAAPYPAARLREAWIRFLWHQFHDDVTGTALPQAYQFTWNDALVSANQFAGVLTNSLAAIASEMDTTSSGVPLVVYNPLSVDQVDAPVIATLDLKSGAPGSFQITDRATAKDVPFRVLDRTSTQMRVAFFATVPSVGFKVFDVHAGQTPGTDRGAPGGRADLTAMNLEDSKYRVHIDPNGDIASIFDKDVNRELLAAPIRLEMRDNPSPDKPAWRILWETVSAPPREVVKSPVIRLDDSNAAQPAIQITRQAAGSTIVQRVSLANGGVRVDNFIDWKSTNTLLKASFPFVASNPKATFDLGLGTIQRPNETPDAYEVPAQWWADITDRSGDFGAAVMTDSKYGWDKPADNTLRLTLLHTPLPRASAYQASQDLGKHQFAYVVVGHRGDWRRGQIPTLAAALNQPLIAFQTTSHSGSLGGQFSFASLTDRTGQFAIRAIKRAEDSDEIVVRVQELFGRSGDTRLNLAAPVAAAREINAAEEAVGPIAFSGDGVPLTFKPYQPRTVAIRLAPRSSRPRAIVSMPVDIPYTLDGFSGHSNRADGNFDGTGVALPAEQWTGELMINSIGFLLGPTGAAEKNVLVPDGQVIKLPGAPFDHVYLLMSAVGGDTDAHFEFERRAGAPIAVSARVREWQGPIGQWYSPLKDHRLLREIVPSEMRGQSWTQSAIAAGMVTSFDPATGRVSGIDQIRPAFVKRDEIAWVATHRHIAGGDQVYVPAYVFLYGFDLPVGTTALRLPRDPSLRVLAISVARGRPGVRPADALYSKDLPDR
jgi:alpha-mannosidase